MKIKWSLSALVLWSFAWRSFIYSIIPVIVFGVIGGIFLSATGHSGWLRGYYAVVWYGISIPISIVAMKQTIEVYLTRLIAIGNSAQTELVARNMPG